MDTLDELRAQQGGVSAEQVEAEQPVEQEVEQAEPVKPVEPEPKVSIENQGHIRELREKARKYESLEREHNEMKRKLQEYETKTPKAEPLLDDDDINISPDDIVEGKHIKKVIQSYKRDIKQLREALENVQKHTESTTAEARLKAAYPDIEKVINDENIAQLQELEPETAALLRSSGDFYNKAIVAYKAIKRAGIYKEDEFAADRERAARNSLKPRASASVTPQQGESPLARAGIYQNSLTDEAKSLLWKEMQESMKMR